MKLKIALLVALLTVGLVPVAQAVEVSDTELAALKKQLAELDQKIRVLEREREIDGEAAAAQARVLPKITLGGNGLSITSGDTNFNIQLHGVVQLDNRTFFNDGGANGNDGFLLRRARPIISGTLFRDFDFLFMPDFGGNTAQIQDAWLSYRYAPWLQVQAGKFKSPVGLEHLQADPQTFFNERSLVTALVPNRDLGIQLKGDVFAGRVSYALAIFNGQPDFNGTTVNTSFQDDRAFAGRLFLQPWKNADNDWLRGLGFGVAGSYLVNHPNTNSASGLTPGYSTDGQQRFFTFNSGVSAAGEGWRISPQAYYYHGALGVLAEYVLSAQRAQRAGVAGSARDLQNSAWQVTVSWLLTGEDASYTSVNPRRVFDPLNGGWGAWQLVARYAALDVDDLAFLGAANQRLADPTKSAAGALSWALGLNWYLNRSVRVNASYSRTVFSSYGSTAFAPGGVPAQPENVFSTRIQLAF